MRDQKLSISGKPYPGKYIWENETIFRCNYNVTLKVSKEGIISLREWLHEKNVDFSHGIFNFIVRL